MKKLSIILAATMLMSLIGCTTTDGVAQAEYDALKTEYDAVLAERDALLGVVAGYEAQLEAEAKNQPSVTDPQMEAVVVDPGEFDEDEVLSLLEIEKYSYNNGFARYAFLVIKNNSGFTLDVSAVVRFYDGSDELVGVKDKSIKPIAPGQEVVVYFMPDEAFTEMVCELSVSEDERYKSMVSDLSYESVPAKDKEIVSVTNNGTEDVKYVKVQALFFKNGKVVGYSKADFTDDDSELKSGKTVTKELNCFDDYDEVRFFLAGQAYK